MFAEDRSTEEESTFEKKLEANTFGKLAYLGHEWAGHSDTDSETPEVAIATFPRLH